MADQTITPVAMTEATMTSAYQAGASLTVANDGVFTVPQDRKWVLLLKVTNKGTTGTITVNAGTGFRSVLGNYAYSTASLTNDDWIAFTCESARFKAVSGADIGKIRIDLGGSATAATAVVLTLPD